MIGPLAAVKRRRGLWYLPIAMLLFSISIFISFGSASLSVETGTFAIGEAGEAEPTRSVVDLSATPAWADLPILGAGDAPIPGEGDIFTATPLPNGGFYYQVDYASGARYEARLQADGRASSRYDEHQRLGPQLAQGALVVFGLISGALGVASVAWNLTSQDPEAREISNALDITPLGRHLIERWLRRSRWYRFTGAAVGIVAGFAAQGEADAAIVLGVAGVAVGGAVSEIHLLRRSPHRAAVASLEVRRVADYTQNIDTYALGVVAAVSLLSFASTLTGVLPDGRSKLALLALAIAAITRLFQHQVVSRARPAIRSDLRSADDLLRFLAASQGFTRPAIALGFFLLSASIAADTTSSLTARISSTLLLVAGLVWLFIGRSSRIPKMAERFAAT